MAYAYIVGHIDIHDMETYRDYRAIRQAASTGALMIVDGI